MGKSFIIFYDCIELIYKLLKKKLLEKNFLTFKANNHEFKIINEVYKPTVKCKCQLRWPNIIMIKCYHIYSCHQCITGNKKKESEKCRQTYEKNYIEPFYRFAAIKPINV